MCSESIRISHALQLKIMHCSSTTDIISSICFARDFAVSVGLKTSVARTPQRLDLFIVLDQHRPQLVCIFEPEAVYLYPRIALMLHSVAALRL